MNDRRLDLGYTAHSPLGLDSTASKYSPRVADVRCIRFIS
jgi:hypothetical protein